MKVKGIAKLLSAVMTITCISFPAISHAENTAEESSAVKVDFAIKPDYWNHNLLPQGFYIGEDTGEAGAAYTSLVDGISDTNYVMSMNDNTLKESEMRTDKGVNQNPSKPVEPVAPDPTDNEKYPNGEEDANYITDKAAYDALMVEYNEKLEVYNKAKNMIEPNTGWGFHGMNINTYESETGKYFGGVINLKPYKDTAAAVYKIKIEEGELDGAYLSVGYYSTLSDTNKGIVDNRYDTVTEFDPTVVGDADAGMWTLRIAGVKLSDYYNDSNEIDADGYHTVIVPLSAFEKANADFRQSYKSVEVAQLFDNTTELNYAMVKAIGISRVDSKSGKTFKYASKGFAFAAPSAPTNVKAEMKDNNAVITWTPSADTDVTTKLVKVVNRVKTYIDVTGGQYTDTEISDGEEVSYYLEATDNTYGVKAASATVYVNKTEPKSEIAVNMNAAKEAYRGAGPHYSNAENYYTGVLGQWGYEDYYGISVGGNNAECWLNDSNYVWTDDSSSLKGNIGAAQPYGYAGYRFNRVSAGGPGAVVDLRDHSNGYAVYEVKFADGQDLKDVYLTMSYCMAWSDVVGYTDGMTYGDSALEVPDRAATVGVKAADYYDTSKGGYQKLIVPLSAFTDAGAPAMKDMIVNPSRYESEVSAARESDFAEHMDLFAGMYISRKNQKNAKSFRADIKNLYIVDTAAPSGLASQYTDNGVVLTWKEAPVENVSKYEIYRNGRKITTVDGLTYTDTTRLKGGNYTYGVKTVSPTYENVVSAAAETAVTVPDSESITFYAGTGEGRTETKYITSDTIDVDIMSVTSNARGYAAVFDAQGVLKAVKTASLGSRTPSTLTFTNVLSTDKVKAFIWNSDMTPVCDESEIESKGTNVLVIGDNSSVQSSEYLDDIASADGGKFIVTNVYSDNSVMNTIYKNLSSNAAVYTKAVNGNISADMVSINDVLGGGDWDYIILQDKTVYSGISAYYAEGGKCETEIPAIISTLKAAAPNAKIYANGAVGYTDVYYTKYAPEDVKQELDEVGSTSFDTSYMFTTLATLAFEGKADGVVDNNLKATNYKGALFAGNGYDLSADGKFFTAAYIYTTITGKAVKASYAPADVTDAEGIISAITAE